MFVGSFRFTAAILWIAVLCYFTLFWNLGADAMQEWDEAHNGVNAILMSENHNWLVRYYDDRPDMWETKPPLLIWLQVLSINSFGYNLWAFRLPSAVAAVGTVALLFWFLFKQTGSWIPGTIGASVLLSSAGFLFVHCARTADHDSLLLFFETGFLISFYNYLIAEPGTKARHLLWAVLCFTFGVFTKSIAIFMLMPGVFLYSLYQWKILELLKDWRMYVYTFTSLLVIGLYYYLHERQTPGYLYAVWNNELFPRFFNSASTYDYKKVQGPFHYLSVLSGFSFKRWTWWILPAAFAAILLPSLTSVRGRITSRKNLYFDGVSFSKVQSLAIFFLAQAVIFYIIISTGTYNPWYVNPILPMLAALIGLGFYSFFLLLSDRLTRRVRPMAVVAGFLIVFLLILLRPIRETLKTAGTHQVYPGVSYGYLFDYLREQNPSIRTFYILSKESNQSLTFYRMLYSKVYGYHLPYLDRPDRLVAGDLVMTADPDDKETVERLHRYETVAANEYCTLYRVLGPK